MIHEYLRLPLYNLKAYLSWFTCDDKPGILIRETLANERHMKKYVLCAWIIGDINFSTMNGLSDWEIETAALRVREVDIFTQLFNVFLLFYLLYPHHKC